MRFPTTTNGSRIFFALSLIIVAVVAFGFGQTINSALIHAPSPRPWILYAHISLFAGWILLFVTQSALIRSKRVAWHRRLGAVGVLLGCLMPFVATGAVFAMKHLHAAEGHIVSDKVLLSVFRYAGILNKFRSGDPMASAARLPPAPHVDRDVLNYVGRLRPISQLVGSRQLVLFGSGQFDHSRNRLGMVRHSPCPPSLSIRFAASRHRAGGDNVDFFLVAS